MYITQSPFGCRCDTNSTKCFTWRSQSAHCFYFFILHFTQWSREMIQSKDTSTNCVFLHALVLCFNQWLHAKLARFFECKWVYVLVLFTTACVQCVTSGLLSVIAVAFNYQRCLACISLVFISCLPTSILSLQLFLQMTHKPLLWIKHLWLH